MQFDVQLYATTTSAGLQWCFNLVAACSLNTGRCDPHGSECRTKNLLGVQSTFGLGRCGKPRLGKVDEVSLEGTKKPNCLGLKKRESLLFWGHLWGDWLVPHECSWNYQIEAAPVGISYEMPSESTKRDVDRIGDGIRFMLNTTFNHLTSDNRTSPFLHTPNHRTKWFMAFIANCYITRGYFSSQFLLVKFTSNHQKSH